MGDGCTIAGAWKGLKDLYAAGFIDRLPRLISVQAEGCCPLNRAIETGKPWEPMAELNYYDRKRVHNLKYYTWVEQQGRDMHELNDLWYGSTWDDVHRQAAALDELITAFNEETGVLKRL